MASIGCLPISAPSLRNTTNEQDSKTSSPSKALQDPHLNRYKFPSRVFAHLHHKLLTVNVECHLKPSAVVISLNHKPFSKHGWCSLPGRPAKQLRSSAPPNHSAPTGRFQLHQVTQDTSGAKQSRSH